VTTDKSLADDFKTFAAHPESVLEGALLVARFIDPQTDVAGIQKTLISLAERVGSGASAQRVLAVLRDDGFRGAESYYEARNSALGHVLLARCGIPISLAVVILSIAQLLDLKAQGINFPGHFLLLLERQLVDPFALKVVEGAARTRLYNQAGLPPGALLPPADARAITLRMLNNLKGIALAAEDWSRALECTDLQLLLAPSDLGIRMERVQLWVRLGVTGMALQEKAAALALCPDPPSRARVEALLAGEQRAQTGAEAPGKLH
jgi:regulator of sirC expression with transglutaminase-like and TPR domain